MPKLQRFLDKFESVFKRSDTMRSAERYVTGLLSDIPYKNCGMIAEFIEGTSVQALQQFISDSPWDHDRLNEQRVKYMVENAVKGDGAIIFDDTGFPKKGDHSVGVNRQYSGTFGKVDNCQVAVSSQYSDSMYSWPINSRLYMPEKWIEDEQKRKRTKVPQDIKFMTKVQIALELLDSANSMGVKHSIVLADCFYGQDPTFLQGLESREETYGVCIPGHFTVKFESEIDGQQRLSPPYRMDYLIGKLSEEDWKSICWREGSKGELKRQFAFIRARWSTKSKLGTQGWVIFERPIPGEEGDIKYYFSNLPLETPDFRIVEYLHRRHTIERFYQDAKYELGLDHFEGRTWNGFHRHFAMVMLAYSWLTLQRKIKHTRTHQYEVVSKNPVVKSPAFHVKGLFSPYTLCDE